MKCGMIGWEFPPFKAGGLGIHCLELTRGLLSRGVMIDFYMPETPDRVEPLGVGMRIFRVPILKDIAPYEREGVELKDFFDAVYHYNLRAVDLFLEESADVDLIHCHDWITVKAGVELKRRLGKPLIFTVHSTEYDRSADFYPQDWIISIEKEGAESADLVIAVSERTKKLVHDRYGVSEEKIRVVENGVDFGKFWWHKKRNYSNENCSALYLGRVTRQKGPDLFVRVAKRVADAGVNCTFLICGKGEMIDDCRSLAHSLGVGDRVVIKGEVSDDELVGAYYDSDIFLLPALSEPFGITVIEAMATGLPAIISNSTGVGESLRHCLKCDFWDMDDMADYIIALLNHRVLRETMGRNGAREAMKFTWDRTCNGTLRVYQEALS
jgi:glycosyltransferase involved in cell wall biosynthesis